MGQAHLNVPVTAAGDDVAVAADSAEHDREARAATVMMRMTVTTARTPPMMYMNLSRATDTST